MSQREQQSSKPLARVIRLRPATKAAMLGIALSVAVMFGAETRAQPSAVHPRGQQAGYIADLWWLLFALGTAVFIVVMAVIVIALVRRRPEGHGTKFVLGGGAIIPLVILVVVFGATLGAMRALSGLAEPDALRVHVIGHQFWWEVRYPGEGVVTANEIHIPVGQPVQVDLVTDDVIHSFWIPQLAGKLDLIPGKTNTLWLDASEAGEYRGQCAEFCGIQHANMAFLVVAQPDDEFADWLEGQRRDAAVATTGSLERGQEIFLSSACVYCHTVRGTNATGELGPDLTHLASRRTLAAGTLENNRGNLAGWIVDPQAIKPGNRMPGIDLGSEDLQALLTYLESLE